MVGELEYDALLQLDRLEEIRTMAHAMTKRQLDMWGGVGSILAGAVCVYFAQQHGPDESIYKLFMGLCVLLVLNGIAMIVWANRPRKSNDPDRTTRF